MLEKIIERPKRISKLDGGYFSIVHLEYTANYRVEIENYGCTGRLINTISYVSGNPLTEKYDSLIREYETKK